MSLSQKCTCLLTPVLLMSFIVFSQSATHTTVKRFIAKRNYIKAQEQLLDILANTPNDAIAIELLADVYSHQAQWDNAINYYKKLTVLHPNTANYHYKLGGVTGLKAQRINKFRALGLISTIKSSFLKAAALDTTHISVRWALVDLYISLPKIVGGSTKKAFKYANELEALSKLDGYLAKGYVYEYDDDPNLAETYYKRAIQESKSIRCESPSAIEDPHLMSNARQTISRNALRYQIGKLSSDYNVHLQKGERCLNAFIKYHTVADGVPKAWAYYRLAQVYKHQGNKTKALHTISKALRLKPNFKQAIEEQSHILKM